MGTKTPPQTKTKATGGSSEGARESECGEPAHAAGQAHPALGRQVPRVVLYSDNPHSVPRYTVSQGHVTTFFYQTQHRRLQTVTHNPLNQTVVTHGPLPRGCRERVTLLLSHQPQRSGGQLPMQGCPPSAAGLACLPHGQRLHVGGRTPPLCWSRKGRRNFHWTHEVFREGRGSGTPRDSPLLPGSRHRAAAT